MRDRPSRSFKALGRSDSDATRTAAGAVLFFVRKIKLCRAVNLLNVVELVEGVNQALHAGCFFTGKMRFIGRLPGDFCHFGLEAGRFKSFRNRVERFRSAGHLNGAVFVRNHVFGTRIKRDLHHLVFCR